MLKDLDYFRIFVFPNDKKFVSYGIFLYFQI